MALRDWWRTSLALELAVEEAANVFVAVAQRAHALSSLHACACVSERTRERARILATSTYTSSLRKVALVCDAVHANVLALAVELIHRKLALVHVAVGVAIHCDGTRARHQRCGERERERESELTRARRTSLAVGNAIAKHAFVAVAGGHHVDTLSAARIVAELSLVHVIVRRRIAVVKQSVGQVGWMDGAPRRATTYIPRPWRRSSANSPTYCAPPPHADIHGQ